MADGFRGEARVGEKKNEKGRESERKREKDRNVRKGNDCTAI